MHRRWYRVARRRQHDFIPVSTLKPNEIDRLAESLNYIANEKLPDGRSLVIRAIRSDDKPILQEGWHHLSKQSQYFRFFTSKGELTEQELAFFTNIDFKHHVGLLASIVVDDSETPVGVGRYIVTDGEACRTAELAFTVVEEYQGLGIATILLKHLIVIAKSQGISEFTAFVLPENKGMLKVLHKSGLKERQTLNSVGVWEISLPLQS